MQPNHLNEYDNFGNKKKKKQPFLTKIRQQTFLLLSVCYTRGIRRRFIFNRTYWTRTPRFITTGTTMMCIVYGPWTLQWDANPNKRTEQNEKKKTTSPLRRNCNIVILHVNRLYDCTRRSSWPVRTWSRHVRYYELYRFNSTGGTARTAAETPVAPGVFFSRDF